MINSHAYPVPVEEPDFEPEPKRLKIETMQVATNINYDAITNSAAAVCYDATNTAMSAFQCCRLRSG